MAKRDKNLAALAALGALGYMATRNKSPEEAAATPVEDRGDMLRRPAAPASAVDRGDDRDIGGGVHPGGFRRNVSDSGEMYDPGTVEDRTPKQRPVVSTPGGRVADSTRSMAPAKQKLLKTDEDFPPVRMPAKSTTSTSPGTMGAYVSRAGTRTGPASSAQSQYETAEREARTPEAVAKRKSQAEGQALERVSPEEYMGPGAGLKGAAALAKKLASYTPKSKAGKEIMQDQIPMTNVPLLTGPAAATRSAGPVPRLPAPAAPRGDASQTVRGGRTRFNEDEVGMEFKRGGKVKKMASGGSTSSASRRGDGIAQRGKTKGRMY